MSTRTHNHRTSLGTRRGVSHLARGMVLVGAVMASVLTMTGPASALATEGGPGGQVVTGPSASPGVQSASIEAVSPTISPAARRVRYVSNVSSPCPTGNLCVIVWDPTRPGYKVFDLYYCNRYYLSYWHGAGYFLNSQTGGVRSYFYDQHGKELRSFTPRPGLDYQSWDPVWSIRNC